jgi:hypothetical protein
MTLSAMRRHARRRFIALAIVFVGCGSALVIYATATPVPANPLGYDPEDSKQYLREMEVYGGKANVFASDSLQWIESLWHGRRLAFTVFCLTVLLLLFFWVASTPLPPRIGPPPWRDQ